MLTPEMLLFAGCVLVIISVFLLIAALHAREWFFVPEPKLKPARELQPITTDRVVRRR